MDERLQTVVKAIKDQFGSTSEEFRGDVTLFVPAQHLVRVAQILRDEYAFEMLLDLTAVDYWPAQSPRFHLVVHLYSISQNLILRLRVPLDGNAPTLHTLEGIYPNANWKEREVWDMFGIRFEGHSDLRRIVMPADWQGHPLRKDYPLGYEENQFSFNAEAVNRRKPFMVE